MSTHASSLFFAAVFACLSTMASHPVHAEVIGQWQVTPPDAASLVSGGGSSWNWLNVTNAPVSVNDAFTGSLMLDDGYANPDPGTTVEVTFNSGVTNLPGPDLVLFEAAYILGSYQVSSDYDSFVAQYSPTFVMSGQNRSYYYGGAGGGPYYADIWGGEIDLSNLGVPANVTVNRIRFSSAGSDADPVAIGSLNPCLDLAVENLIANQVAFWFVSGGTNGQTVAVVYGRSPGQTVVNGTGGYCATFGIKKVRPKKLIGTGITTNGVATIARFIPPNFQGVQILTQAAERNRCPGECVSNVLSSTIQ